MNKITKEEFIEAIQFIVDWGKNPDGYIQKNFRNFLNSYGDADDNSIQLNDEHRQQLQIVDNIEENLDLLLQAQRERIILIIKGRLLIKKIRDPIIKMIRDLED